MKQSILPVMMLTLISACATKPIALEDATPIPADRRYSEIQQYADTRSGYAKVNFVRDAGMVGAAISLTLLVNGELIARIRRKEILTIYLPAGSHDLALGPGKLTSGPAGQGLVEQVLQAESGAEYSYRVGLDMNVGLVLERTDQAH